MSSYSFVIKQGDHVLNSIENVVLPDPTEAWSFIQELSNQFPSLRLLVALASVVCPRLERRRSGES
jgi:hypothetical protein